MTLMQRLRNLLETDFPLPVMIDGAAKAIIKHWPTDKPVAQWRELEILETGNGFYIYEGNKGWGMGDGVDQYFDADDKALRPGTLEFYRAMQDDLESSYNEFLEAYFD